MSPNDLDEQVAARVPRRTAFYARITHADGETEQLSLPNQRARFHEIASRECWSDVEVYEEKPGTSGALSPDRRPALRRLLDDAAAGRIERIVVRHQDRLGRGAVLDEVTRRIDALDIEFRTFDGPVDLRSAGGRLSSRVQAVVGAFEVERAGERVREAKRGRARAGIYCGPCPFGFTSQSRLRRQLEEQGIPADTARVRAQEQCPVSPGIFVDPDEAAIVREVFGAYLAGKGVRQIAAELNGRGLRRRGGRWYPNTVRKILRDPKVQGLTTYDEDGYQARRRGKWSPIHKQARFDGVHDAIVDAPTFERVQLMLSRRASKLAKAREGQRNYFLSGAIVDGAGHVMKGHSSGVRSSLAYYCCGIRSRVGRSDVEGGCSSPPVRADLAEAAVLSALTEVLTSPDAVLEAWTDAKRRLAEEAPERRRIVRELDAEVSGLQREREGVFAAFRNPDLSSEQHAELAERVRELNARIKSLAASRERTAPTVIQLPVRDLRREDVARYLGSLTSVLARDPNQARELVLLLRRHHGLEVRALDADRLEVRLALDSTPMVPTARAAGGAKAEGPKIPLLVEARVRPHRTSAAEWVKAESAKGHDCECGCGEQVEVTASMRAPSRGIPRYIHGHHRMAMTDLIGSLNEEGFITIAQAAVALGVGETTLRRAEEKGWVVPERRAWGRRAAMRVYRADQVASLKAMLAKPAR